VERRRTDDGRLPAGRMRCREVARMQGAMCAPSTGRLVLDGDAVTPGGWLGSVTCGPTCQWVYHLEV